MTYDGAAETNPLYITALYISAPFLRTALTPSTARRLLRTPIDTLTIVVVRSRRDLFRDERSRDRE